MSAPNWALECARPDCTFRPDLDAEVQVIADHFAAEHDDAAAELTLVITCPLDGQSLIFGGAAGQVEGSYSCPQCMRTYVLKNNPLGSS